MSRNVIYAGIDVDDLRYHGLALTLRTGEALDFIRRPMLKGLVQAFEKALHYSSGADLKLCPQPRT